MHIKRLSFDESNRLKDESIFTCASGKLGVRGNFEEGCPEGYETIRGTYINGFCETENIKYNEKLYGFTDDKQTICNLPDAQGIEVYANGEKLVCWSDKVSEYSYTLDMSEGVVKRSFVYDTGKGKIQLSFERFTSFVRQGLFVIKCEVKSIDYAGEIKVLSTLNANVRNFTSSKDPRVASGSGQMLKINTADNFDYQGKSIQCVESETINSSRKINTFSFTCFGNQLPLYKNEDGLLTSYIETSIESDSVIDISKYSFYCEQEDGVDGKSELLKAIEAGFVQLKNEQVSYLNDFWKTSRVLIDSDEIKQEHIDLCLYVMLCSAGRDGKTSIAAKGLSGEGYEGHYFWDCETYIYPFFLNTNKQIAKSLLQYRYSKLDKAKEHARKLGHSKGALYPWRTITGSECSSYFPSGSAQYHINGDISRAFIQYWRSTNDYEFLPTICEVLLETSRLWIDLGHYDDGYFKIDCVTGPDEYTCMVNNNYYTNAGAKNNLENAYKLINILKDTKDYETFKNHTNCTDEELDEFKNAADHMYLPYDENLGIIKQDDSFLNKKRMELSEFKKEEFPLLLNYHPLFLYRHQICKQADAILADYLFDGLSASTSMKTFEYYDAVTTHDSSLSKCIFGNVAAKLGDLERAKKYFIETLATDINDCKGNTKDGLHMANMGGCYDMVVGGFAGLKLNENGLSLFPMLPEAIRSYSFIINYLDTNISIKVDEKGVTVSTDGKDIDITIYGQAIKVSKNEITVNRKCKGVIFDLDGVITDTAKYHYLAWKKIAEEFEIDFDEKKNEEFKGVSRKTCLEKLLSWGNIQLSDKEFEETLVRKNDYYKELLNNLTSNDILPGIIDSIKLLHEKGIKVSLFSVSKNTDAILERLGIRDVFDEIVCGNDIVNSKPHYEGYLLAADRMKVEPRLCAMVEDSVSGINGAKALSMKTIAVMKENKANADYCIDNTSKLIDVIKNI